MAKCCVFFIAFPLPVIVRTICLFDNFEKLSILFGFSRDILEGWARVCFVHVFLLMCEIDQSRFTSNRFIGNIIWLNCSELLLTR